jgi:hypothetical protein
MFTIRYTDDIAARKKRTISAATARTLAELPTTQKKSKKTVAPPAAPKAPPQSFDEAFPPALPSSHSNEIDEAILFDLFLNFFEAEQMFQKKLIETTSFYNDELLFVDEDAFAQFHFQNDAGWYQECPECLNNFLTDCSDGYKCSCH